MLSAEVLDGRQGQAGQGQGSEAEDQERDAGESEETRQAAKTDRAQVEAVSLNPALDLGGRRNEYDGMHVDVDALPPDHLGVLSCARVLDRRRCGCAFAAERDPGRAGAPAYCGQSGLLQAPRRAGRARRALGRCCHQRSLRGQFNTSNIYLICRLVPLSFEITPQETEIAEALWLPVGEYLSRDGVGSFSKRVVGVALGARSLRPNEVADYMDDSDAYEVLLPCPRRVALSHRGDSFGEDAA